MSLPAYPQYKDSDVEWLGAVPSGWEIKRLGFYFDERREKVSDTDFSPLSVTKNGVVPQLETAAKSDDGDNRKKVLAGDFVINSRSDRKGSSGISAHDGSVSLINTVLRPRREVFGGFVHHLLRSRPFQEEYYRYGKGIVADLWSTNYSEMRAISLSLPPLSEQRSIATFLDYETSKIDALIAEQEKLLTLLAEKRQATISQAVTKGLNPDVPMKDSGVEWLGDIPEHWESLRVRHVAKYVTTGGTPKFVELSVDLDDGINWYTPGDFDGNLKLGRSQRMIAFDESQSEEVKLFPAGAVLIVSIGATLGKLGLIAQESYANQQINAVIPNQRVNGSFLAYALLAQTQVMRFLSNASTIGIMNQEKTKDIPIAVPPINEQEKIVTYLDAELLKFDSFYNESIKSINLLKERRAALISAAVTGKIDVRNYQVKEAA